MPPSFSHRRARIVLSTMAVTAPPSETHAWTNACRMLQPTKFFGRTNRPWRTSTSLATSSPLSPLNQNEEPMNETKVVEIQLPPPPFPIWIRLKASADFSDRQRLTSEVADAISVSGGFISQTNILSDMVTVFVLEDVCPEKLADFQERLDLIVRLDSASREILQECYAQLKRRHERPIPDATMAVLQLNWRNAPGTMRHQIPMDG